MELLLLILFVAVAIVAGYYSYRATQERRRKFMYMARQYGLEYSLWDPFSLLGLPFSLFSKGDGRGLDNVMWGSWQGRTLKCFDYWYFEETSDSKGSHSRSYCRFSCSLSEIPASCPRLTISRESVFGRIADHLGFADIHFESEEFNRAFRVKADDPKFASDFVSPQLMAWLLASGGDFAYEVVGPYVLCYHKRLKPTALLPMWAALKSFCANVPRVVYELYPPGGLDSTGRPMIQGWPPPQEGTGS
ncbi:MAG: hypothetical protein WDA71_03680 [Actinomycetota bacterium]